MRETMVVAISVFAVACSTPGAAVVSSEAAAPAATELLLLPVAIDLLAAALVQLALLAWVAHAPALMLGLALVNERKAEYRQNGIQYYRPWLFMLTDGSPTDSVEMASTILRDEELSNGVAFFSVLVQGADPEVVASLSSRPPIKLRGLAFRAKQFFPRRRN